MHGSKIIDGKSYCTDCGAHLTVGSYESYRHRNRRTGGRGECPDAAAGHNHLNNVLAGKVSS